MLTWVEPNQPLPPPESARADPNGLVAAGRDLSAKRLLEAYGQGIFPWYSQGQPVLWWSPDPRMVLFPDEFKLSRSLRKTLAKFVRTPGSTRHPRPEDPAPRHRAAWRGSCRAAGLLRRGAR